MLRFALMVVPCANKGLENLLGARSMENKMTSTSSRIPICVYPSKKAENLCAKNQSSKTLRTIQSLNKRETDLINQKRENL
jgi:hypothetical protein